MVTILYITRAKLSLSRAQNWNILKTAEAIQKEDTFNITVASFAPETVEEKQILVDKGIAHLFKLDVSDQKRSLIRYLKIHRNEFDILYLRDPFLIHIILYAKFFLRKKIIFEAHGSYEWRYSVPFWFISVRLAHGAIFITNALRLWYGLIKKPWLVVHTNAIDPDIFNVIPKNKQEKDILRARIGFADDRRILLYTGSTAWYDVEVLVAMLKFLPEIYILVLIGLKDDEIKTITKSAEILNVRERVETRRRIRTNEIPEYLMAADVLLNPPSITYPSSISSKLYEYLASGTPIVSYPAGANTEILRHEENAIIVRSRLPKDFAAAVLLVERDQRFTNQLVSCALRDARQYTWHARALKITAFISRII